MDSEIIDDDFETLLEEYSSSAQIQAAKRDKEASGEVVRPTKRQAQESSKKSQDQLDLHQFTSQEALIRADDFIKGSKRNGLSTVEIITGKGLHSKDGKAKIRKTIRDHVIELKRQNIVINYKWDNGSEQNSGAIIVYL